MTKLLTTTLLLFIVAAVTVTAHKKHKKHDDLDSKCEVCLPGFGVVSMCTETEPTKCAPCADNHWTPEYPHLKKCTPCSKCGEGLYEERECSPTQDTRCDRCSTLIPVMNRSYLKVCLKAELPRGMDASDEREKQAIEQVIDEVKRQQELVKKEHAQNPDLASEEQFWQWESDEDADLATAEDTEPRVVRCFTRFRKSKFIQVITSNVWLGTLFGISVITLVLCLIRICKMLRTRGGHRVVRVNGQKLYTHLSDAEQQIVAQCATHLKKNKQYGKLYESETGDLWWEEPMNVVENPLAEYEQMHKSTERLISKN